MSNEWITDRMPTKADATKNGLVFDEKGHIVHYDYVADGEAWKPIPKCEPYVKPQRYVVKLMQELDPGSHPVSGFCVWSTRGGVGAYSIPTREAAERIAAIYEEVMP